MTAELKKISSKAKKTIKME